MIEIRDKNVIAYDASESLLESIIKDVFSGLMLGFCLYISHWADSIFWTFVTGLMFFILSVKQTQQTNKRPRYKI